MSTVPTVYTEEKIGRKSNFIKIIIDSNGEVVSERKVTMPLFQKENLGFTYFILYNDKMEPNRNFFEYINYVLQDNPLTTRRASAFALRLLYCFLSLSNYDIYHLGEKEINELIRFLRGINSNPDVYATQTIRSASTVNGYLSCYRSFFANRHIQCNALFRSHEVSVSDIDSLGFDTKTLRKRYNNNVKRVNVDQKVVPRYISPEIFKKLYVLAMQKNDYVTAVLMHLMYGYGLRPGEALGLTLEDIQEIEREQGLIPVLILRNRMTDAIYQFAKGLPHVRIQEQYSNLEFKKAKWRVQITYDMYEQIVEYIQEVHTDMMERYPTSYSAGVADRIDTYNPELEQNHYVFLNRYGRPLSLQTLNNHLKEYFKELDIPLGSEVRENNLAHRFRHGFAMFQARFRDHPVNALELQKMMRHSRLKSTTIYYNPTPEDELQTRTEAQNELYKMMPELKKGTTYLD